MFLISENLYCETTAKKFCDIILKLGFYAANLRKPDPVTRVPYFGEKDLLTSASLNGGVVFAKFIDMLIEWTRQFDPDVSEEKIYENLIKGALNDSSCKRC